MLRAALGRIATVSDEDLLRTLAIAAVTLARVRLDLGTINQTWKDSKMPIVPNILDELYEQGLEQGLEQGRVELVDSLLRDRFPRASPARRRRVADTLGHLPTDEIVTRLNTAHTIDDLDT